MTDGGRDGVGIQSPGPIASPNCSSPLSRLILTHVSHCGVPQTSAPAYIAQFRRRDRQNGCESEAGIGSFYAAFLGLNCSLSVLTWLISASVGFRPNKRGPFGFRIRKYIAQFRQHDRRWRTWAGELKSRSPRASIRLNFSFQWRLGDFIFRRLPPARAGFRLQKYFPIQTTRQVRRAGVGGGSGSQSPHVHFKS